MRSRFANTPLYHKPCRGDQVSFYTRRYQCKLQNLQDREAQLQNKRAQGKGQNDCEQQGGAARLPAMEQVVAGSGMQQRQAAPSTMPLEKALSLLAGVVRYSRYHGQHLCMSASLCIVLRLCSLAQTLDV